MLNMNSISVSGTSRIEGKDVVFFSASFSAGKAGNYSSTKNITDKETYMKNQEQCEADYMEFDAAAMNIMSQAAGMQ